MKKLSLAMAVSAALAAGAANASNLGQAATGLMVPNVIHNGATDTTAVGMVARDAATVYWVFFDVNSNHITDGQFPVTANDVAGFIWANEAGVGLDGVRGYLVFTMDLNGDGVVSDGDTIGKMTGNAFHVTPGDVAYVPALPLVMNGHLDATSADSSSADYVLPINLPVMNGASITGARMTAVRASEAGVLASRMDMRYFIDGTAGGDTTYVNFWTADEMPAPVTWTANMYDTAQNRKSINFVLPNANMNSMDVEGIAGRPAAFLDGFIELNLPDAITAATTIGLREFATQALMVAGAGAGPTATGTCDTPYNWPTAGVVNAYCGGGVLAYSVVISSVFGAAQTLMGGHN